MIIPRKPIAKLMIATCLMKSPTAAAVATNDSAVELRHLRGGRGRKIATC